VVEANVKAIKSWLVGAVMGSALGVILVVLFAPFSDKEARERLTTGYREAISAAREAGRQRRAELEAELAEIQQRRRQPDEAD
jgi:gas vesicle protein